MQNGFQRYSWMSAAAVAAALLCHSTEHNSFFLWNNITGMRLMHACKWHMQLQVYLLASHYCVLDDVIKPPGHFLVHVFGHIQLLDLSSKLGTVAMRVPFINIGDATLALHCEIAGVRSSIDW